MIERRLSRAYILFFSALLLNMAFLFMHQDKQARWANVPPVPAQESAPFTGLGDRQFAYRSFGLVIQNMGDFGGRVTPLKDYNIERLGQWFRFMHVLDPQSNYIPFLAAYYFAAADNIDNYAPLSDYLADIGSASEDQKWRWLAQAVFIARYKEKNMEKALRFANDLAALDNEDMPAWTKQMPAFVSVAMGDKEAALGILVGILGSNTGDMHPAEVYNTKLYICEQILDETQAADYPLCKDIQQSLE